MLRKTRRRALRRRDVLVLLVIVLALTGPLLLSTWYAFTLQKESLERSLTIQMDHLVDVLSNGMREPIWNLTPGAGRDLVRSVMETPQVLAVRVVSLAQRNFLGEMPAEASLPATARTLVRDVIFDGEKIGRIELVYDAAGPQSAGLVFPMSMSFALGVQVLISIGIVFLMFRHLVNMERVRAEEAAAAEIRESEERLRSVIENSPSYIVLTDLEGRLELANRKCIDIFGEDPATLLGRDRHSLFRGDYAALVKEQERQVIETEDTVTAERQLHTDGGLRHIIVTMFPIMDENDRLSRVGTIATDITERKEAEINLLMAKGQAEKASIAKSEFLASVSHDLRTPLNAIIGFADMIRNQFFGSISEQYRGYADDIHRSGQHLLELVDQILDLSAIESGKHLLDITEVDVRDVVVSCRQTVEMWAGKENVGLNVNMPDGDLFLAADRRSLMQILLNLLTNAIKFTEPGGTVTLTVVPEGQRVRFEVADTGCGIAEEDVQRILQPFARAEANPFLTKEGWGLGLPIARGLIDIHGGAFELTSDVGQGTTVRFWLPAAGGAAHAEMPPAAKRQA